MPTSEEEVELAEPETVAQRIARLGEDGDWDTIQDDVLAVVEEIRADVVEKRARELEASGMTGAALLFREDSAKLFRLLESMLAEIADIGQRMHDELEELEKSSRRDGDKIDRAETACDGLMNAAEKLSEGIMRLGEDVAELRRGLER